MSSTNWPVRGRVRFIGARSYGQTEIGKFFPGMVGCITLEFNNEWDELPYRDAVFMAINPFGSSKKEVTVPDISESVVIPQEVLAEPYTKVYFGVVGKDAKPDARGIEIVKRLNAIDVEMLSADYETSGFLLDEHKALCKELKGLNMPKMIVPSLYCFLGVVCPKCNYGY